MRRELINIKGIATATGTALTRIASGTLLTVDFAIVAIIFGTFVVPWFIALASSPILTYSNAWDEETYLSYQGALAARNSPGYLPLHLVVLLHRLGVSGSVQNCLLDLVAPAAIILCIYAAARVFGRSRSISLCYGV